MKFGLMFANAGPFGSPEALTNLAQSAESAGFESIWTVEHVVVPVGYTAEYPYSGNGRMPGPENSPIPDPVLPLAFAAAVTTELRLATGVMILPQRHPTYVAKEMATLDQLSKGRAILGVGIGWLHEEFAAVGVPFAERVARTEESIRAIRSLWKGEAAAFKGDFYSWEAVESNPKPVQPGGVPIVVGGHVNGAARRAARFGDGFFPAKGDEARVTELLKVVAEECDAIGRNPAEVEFTAGLPGMDLDAIRRYEDMGVVRLMLPPPAFDPEGLRKGLDGFGNNIIAKL
jgi:probable F420-dependent oxidoreductase